MILYYFILFCIIWKDFNDVRPDLVFNLDLKKKIDFNLYIYFEIYMIKDKL